MIVWYSILYFPLTVLLASRRPLWNDELFTFYIARLRSLSRIWQALLTGAEQIPPLFHWATGVVMGSSHDPRIAIRAPEIFGYWLMGVCLIAFVSRRLPSSYGLFAAMVTLISGAYTYAYDARPYGIMLGLGALALVCWQRAGDSHGALWTFGLAVTLAALVSVHYYACLLFVPLATGETVRSCARRRLRWSMWVAFCCGVGPTLFYLPLLRAASRYAGAFSGKASVESLGEVIRFLLVPAALPLGLVTIAAGLVLLLGTRTRWISYKKTAHWVPAEELAAMLGYLAIPAIAVPVAMAFNGPFNTRYVLSAVIGVGVFASSVLAAIAGGNSRAALAAAALSSVAFLTGELRRAETFQTASIDQATMLAYLRNHAPAGMGIAIAEPQLYLELSHAAPADLRTRLFYFPDTNIAFRYFQTDTVDRCLLGISESAPLRLENLPAYLNSGQPFLVYGYPALRYPLTFAWLIPELVSLQVPMSVVGMYGGRMLLLARPLQLPAAVPLQASGLSHRNN